MNSVKLDNGIGLPLSVIPDIGSFNVFVASLIETMELQPISVVQKKCCNFSSFHS